VGAEAIAWLSPLGCDDYAEYRDGSFLRVLGLEHLAGELRDFWPARGPQWDALGRTDAGHVLLVEAKAHIGEFCSPPSQASDASLRQICDALAHTARAMGVSAESAAGWHRHFYQYTNRLAHLRWLREQAVDAKLVFVNFIHDDDMPGETTQAAWEAARRVADHVLGIGRRHLLSRHVIHVFPDVRGK